MLPHTALPGGRQAIALYRITGYDGRDVEYWYREHPTDRKVWTKVTAYEFIARLIQHIPSKGLKLVRHYGLYARVKFRKVKEIIERIFKRVKTISQEFVSFLKENRPLNYRERLQKSFGVDPYKCPRCGKEMILHEIYHPKYGTVYDIFRDENWVEVSSLDVVEEEKPKEQRGIRQDRQLYLFEMQSSN